MRELLSNVAAKICAIVLFAVAVGAGFFALIGIDVVFNASYYSTDSNGYYLYQMLHPYEELFVPLLIICIIIALSTLIFLLCASGRRKDVENFTPNFLDRVPFDLYLAIDIVLFLLSIILFDNVLFFGVAISLPLCVLIVSVMGL